MGAKLAASGLGSKRGRPDVNSEPNVVPFIDVMLVLLIIFMVAAPIATVDINVDLPGSVTIPSQRPPKPTYISLQDQGPGLPPAIFVDNEPVELGQLRQATLQWVIRNNQGQITEQQAREERIYIRADSSTQYREIMRIMNTLQDEGFFKLALVAQDKR
jgi:biopolymer transport protein ExbD